MIVYIAGGFTITQVRGREKLLYEKFGGAHRLMSFYFHFEGTANIMQIFELKKEIVEGQSIKRKK